jgi:hypothetical protein
MFRSLTTVTVVVALALAAGAIAASAQDKVPDARPDIAPPKLDPKACADRDRLTQGDTHESQGRAPTSESTSDKLARTEGVICPPPGLDPDIRIPAPDSGKMPVIPPPGSPGGDPSVRPK